MMVVPTSINFRLGNRREKPQPVSVRLKKGLLREGLLARESIGVQNIFSRRQTGLLLHVEVTYVVMDDIHGVGCEHREGDEDAVEGHLPKGIGDGLWVEFVSVLSHFSGLEHWADLREVDVVSLRQSRGGCIVKVSRYEFPRDL